jgi:copper(I)-binding protein
MLKRSTLLFVLLLIELFLVACTSGDQGGIAIEGVWGRPSPSSASNAAFYMTIENTGQEPDSLFEAAIDICRATELHISNIDDAGVMSMQQVQQIDIPAGETVALEPGGLHVMCIDRQADLTPGDLLSISLSFTQAGEIVVEAEIREN